MVDTSWSEDNEVHDEEQQGVADFEDADSLEGVLADSAGTATVSGDVVNEDGGNGTEEADSGDSQVGCDTKESDENTVQYANIPDELTKVDRWVCWKVEERDGDETKVPVNPHTGEYAKSNDENTWASFEQTVDHYETHDEVAGIGFMFSHDGRYAGVDLDKCVDPETGDVEPWARDIVERLDSYTEFSPSGTGLHVIVEGIVPPDGSRSGNVEMYDKTRYFTFTGDVGMGAPKSIKRRVGALKDVHADYIQSDDEAEVEGTDGAHDGVNSTDPSEPTEVDLDDEELIEKAKNAENGDKFDALWNGSTAGYPSQSEADEALCCLLAFWTGGDRARMDSLFRQSDLMRPKWDKDRGSQTYGERTIDAALSQVDEYYDPDEGGRVDMDDVLEDADEDSGSAVGALSTWLSDYKKKEEKTPKKGEKTQEAARALLEYERFATVGDKETVYRYHDDEGVWKDDGRERIRHVLDRALGSEFSTRVLNETVERVRARTAVDRDDFEMPKDKVPFQNGLLNLETRELRDYRPKDYVTSKLPVEYDKGADAPEFREYLESVTRTGSDRKKLQEYAGYSLMHGRMPHNKALFLAGPQASGKSTFINVISALLPDDVVGASTPHQLTRRFGKACLQDRWLNVSADIPSEMIGNTGTFKMITGTDRVEGEIKGVQEKPEFTPTTKHIFSANQLPEVYNADDAFWRRTLIVPFPHIVPGDDRIKDLNKKLVEKEGSGILNWMLDGYERLVEQDGFTADRTLEETKKLWHSWSTPVIRFYARCLRDEVGASEPVDEVYDAYKTFCEKEMDGVMPDAKESFGKQLTKFPHIDSVTKRGDSRHKKRHYVNIQLREDKKPS